MEKAHGDARADRRAARGALDVCPRERSRVPESGHGHRGGWDVRRVRLARAAVTRARSLRRATWPFLGCVGAIPALRFFGPRRRGAAEARMIWWALAASRTSTRAGSMANPKTTLYVGTSSPSKSPSLAPLRPSSCATRSLRERRLTRRVDPLPVSVLSRRRTRRAGHRGGAARRVSALRRPQGRQHSPRPTDAEEQGIRFRHLHGEVRPATRHDGEP